MNNFTKGKTLQSKIVVFFNEKGFNVKTKNSSYNLNNIKNYFLTNTLVIPVLSSEQLSVSSSAL